jgi:hypothetical protein
MIGKRVTLVEPHIYYGRSGVVVAAMDTLIGPMWKVKLDNGWVVGAKFETLQEEENAQDIQVPD